MRNIAKSSPVGRSMPRLAHATIRMAASVCRLGGLLDRAHDGVERLAAIRYRAAVAPLGRTPEACGAGGHCQRRDISGPMPNGEKQPPSGLARSQRAGEPSVHRDANECKRDGCNHENVGLGPLPELTPEYVNTVPASSERS